MYFVKWFLFGTMIIFGIGCWSEMKRMIFQAMSHKTVKGKAFTNAKWTIEIENNK